MGSYRPARGTGTDCAPRCAELCVEVTTLCPQECLHCSTEAIADERKAVELDGDRVRSLLEWFAGQGGEIVEFSGGDPLTRSDLPELTSFASELGLRTRVYTNGLPSAFADRGVSLVDLARAGADGVAVSLHAATRQVHETITQTPGSFEQTLRTAREAVALGLWTGVHFVPMRPNYRQLRETAELAAGIGASEFAVLRFVAQGRGVRNASQLELTAEQFSCLVTDLAHAIVEQPPIKIRAGCPMNFCSLVEPQIRAKKCKAGTATALVDASGRMYPCAAFKKVAGFEGDAPDHDGDWASVWVKPSWRELRKMSAGALEGSCSVCQHSQTCHGRCAAQRYLAHGSFYAGPDPMCPLWSPGVASARSSLGQAS